jgi:hypothetical protein
MNESSGGSGTPPVHIEFASFKSPTNKLNTFNSRLSNLSPHNTEQLIVYAAPVIQTQISSRCKETVERLKELKKDKSTLLSATNKTPTKNPQQQQQQHEDPQQ